ILEAAARIAGDYENPGQSSFPETGYFVWASRDQREKIVVDAGPPAAGYNSAHAHCDLLSYELWIAGKPFVVDSGVHGYGGDRFREYSRSTRAHNTVMFDGREQSEAWGTFRMARQAQVTDAAADGGEDSWNFRGGYRPCYDASLIHERYIKRAVDGSWIFTDRLTGAGAAARATSFIHLHPDVEVVGESGMLVECSLGPTRVSIEPFGAESLKVIKGGETPIQGWYFPDFGIARPSATICLEYRVRSGETFGYSIIVDSSRL
ncbi:MAG: heparinase II/III-family protein, partial [Blastocatellia bacterium]|nr:heparinase II/III-family protein [Blastocatellia bacterium]